MCDFFSAVIRRDGKVFHLPSNSHSGIVAHFGLTENDTMADMRGVPRFYEFEWDVQGSVPSNITKLLRGVNPPEKVVDAAKVLAKNLRQALDEPGWGLLDDGFFAGEEFADLRWKALIHEKCPHKIAARLAETLLHAQGEAIKSLHPKVTAIEGSWSVEKGYHISAPALTEVAGYIDVRENAKLDAPALTKAGSIYVSENAKLDAPALTKAGYIDVRENAKLDAPKLKKGRPQ